MFSSARGKTKARPASSSDESTLHCATQSGQRYSDGGSERAHMLRPLTQSGAAFFKSTHGAPDQDAAPASMYEVLRSPGQPLDRTTRAFMEQRFGHDFSRVRVHSGGAAERSAREMNADAYAVGHNIVFRAGHYPLGTQDGRRLLAHELTHVVQQSGSDGIRTNTHNETRGLSANPPEKSPRDTSETSSHSGTPVSAPTQPIQANLTIGPAGDRYEQEADRVSDQVTRMSQPHVHRISAAAHAVQRSNGYGEVQMILQNFRSESIKQQYAEFIHKAKLYGLPVKFLTSVMQGTKFIPGADTNVYNATLTEQNLTDETINQIAKMDSLGVFRIYHEGTHAYLYQHRTEEPIKQFYERGTQQYKDAPAEGGRITSDPEEVFQEASAGYVSKRAQAWWQAFSVLNGWIAIGLLTQSRLDGIRAEYDKSMAERVLGYSYEGGWFSKRQVSTIRPITDELRAFLDREVLENKIPDRFDQVALFKEMVTGVPSG